MAHVVPDTAPKEFEVNPSAMPMTYSAIINHLEQVNPANAEQIVAAIMLITGICGEILSRLGLPDCTRELTVRALNNSFAEGKLASKLGDIATDTDADAFTVVDELLAKIKQ